RIGEVKWKGIRCIALVQENHAGGWQNAAGYVARIVATNSKLIGMFAYPKMIAADARDGMEYPMITLDGGSDPGFISLFTHEISHNWFFGMVGTNETYRPFMDEGFTQFYSAYTWEHFVGLNDLFYVDKKEKYLTKYSKPTLVRESDAYMSYYNSVYRNEEVTLNTHSDGFNGALRQGGGYGQVYGKTATMLYNLQYVLGDSLFDAAMQNYFNQWKMCHPYPEDMRNSFIQFTHADLNWFFDEWLETTKTIDYKVKKVKKTDGNKYAITFERKATSMQMPIDFTVFSSDSAPVNYHIPNTWFVKKTSAKVLPRWIGWDKTKKTYTAVVEVKGKIKNVVIDTTSRLADINYMNNSWKKNIAFEFDSKIWNLPNRKKYELYARPALWYNGYDGIKFGANANGNYLGVKHVFDATFYVNTGLAPSGLDSNAFVNQFDHVSFLFSYKTETSKFIKKSNFYANIKIADGLQSVLLGFDKKSNNDKNRYYLHVKGMLRDLASDKNYLLFKNDWQIGKLNNAIHVGMDRNYSYRRGNGAMNINLR
ncbi:MAG: M1 family peptidase, partial [Bacteroidia bacterium]|nr:M1 family peptidase [Bacteroidia bacterium]